MHRWLKTLMLTGFTLLTLQTAVAAKSSDDVMFEKIFSTWTRNFDHKDLAGTCSLFSKNLRANYQGYPEKNYTTLCDSFKKVFQEPREYQYNFKIRQIHRSGDLAAVRITWYLRISEQGKFISESKDEGLDVFQKNKDGNWKIVNYLGFGVHTDHSKKA